MAFCRKKNAYSCSKYGVNHVTATHERGRILHASTKGNDDVRLHVAETDTYLKYFKGHTAR
jgi:COMPASS component SWD2